MTFTDAEQWTIINALHLAAETYNADASRLQYVDKDAVSIVEHFKRQALDAAALADRIEAEG